MFDCMSILLVFHPLFYVLIYLRNSYFLQVSYTCSSIKHVIYNFYVTVMFSFNDIFLCVIFFNNVGPTSVKFTILLLNWYNFIFYPIVLTHFYVWLFQLNHNCLIYNSFLAAFKQHLTKMNSISYTLHYH